MLKRMLVVAAAFIAAAAALADTPPKSKAHGFSVTGTVVSIDNTALKMSVKTPAGKQIPLVWTGATKTAGGTVVAGTQGDRPVPAERRQEHRDLDQDRDYGFRLLRGAAGSRDADSNRFERPEVPLAESPR